MQNKTRIVVVGIGYVGLANPILLAQNYCVIIVNILPEKVNLVNGKKLPIDDSIMEDYLNNRQLNLIATVNAQMAYKDVDLVIICTPTNYNLTRCAT